MDLPCVNCKREFPAEKGLWWERIFLCADCHRVATRIHEQGETRLRWMLSILKQAIKDALLEGRLQLSTPDQQGDEQRFLLQLQTLAKLAKAKGSKGAASGEPAD